MFHAIPYANGGYKNQKLLLCGLDYHGMVIDNITFHKKLLEPMKSKFENLLQRLLFKLIFFKVRG